MAALCAAGRLVRVDAVSVVLHVGELVGRAEERPGIVDRGDAEARVASPVKVAGILEGDEPSVLLHARGQLVVELVAAAGMHEDLFPVKSHLYRPSGLHCKQAGGKLKGARRCLRAEPAADVRLYDPYLADGYVEDHRDDPLDIMGRLG